MQHDSLSVDPKALPETVLVPVEALERFVRRTFERLGVRRSDARIAAEVLVLSDRRGIASHGVGRLDQYVRALQTGTVTARPNVTVVRRRHAVELWDGDHGLGHPVSRRAMRRAITLARRHGIGSVGVRASSHFGIAGAYARQAVHAGLIGVALTNADPIVAPTGSYKGALGTNPIAFGAPAARRTEFLLDMATSVVTGGRFEVARRLSQTVPLGWALDERGRPTSDPSAAQGGALLPLGGSGSVTSGHKGYGLAAAVDILTGVLTGSGSLFDVRSLYAVGGSSRVGHWFLALDPAAFDPTQAFSDRLDSFIDTLKAVPAERPDGEVLVAGEPEARIELERASQIPLHRSVCEMLGAVADAVALSRDWRRVLAAPTAVSDGGGLAAPDESGIAAGRKSEVPDG